MAVRFTAAGQEYTATVSLGYIATFTTCGWVYISSSRANFSGAWTVGVTGDFGNRIFIGTNATGTDIVYQDGLTTSGSVALTTGKWYFIAAAGSSSAGTLYVRAIDATAWTTATWTAGAAGVDFTNVTIGNFETVYWWNGRVSGVKLWINVALTQAEIEQEMWRHLPNRTAALSFWYPLIKPETADYSGNGLTLSGGTSATIEDGPGIPWRGSILWSQTDVPGPLVENRPQSMRVVAPMRR